MDIYTDRLQLCRFDGSEGTWLYDLDNDPEVMRYITGGAGTPRSFIDSTSLPLFCRVDLPVVGTGFWKLIERESDTPVGWCSLRVESKADDAGSLGYRLMRAAWSRGYAYEVCCALLDHAFQSIGLERVTATTYEDNARSRRVLEKLGFCLVREFKEDLGSGQTASLEGAQIFPGLDLEFELRREEWGRFRPERGPENKGESCDLHQ